MSKFYAAIQRQLVSVSYHLHRVLGGRRERTQWVVGVAEVAGMTERIARSVPGAIFALTTFHPFYASKPDLTPPRVNVRVLPMLINVFWGPWTLGRLLTRVAGIVYVGPNGFLSQVDDARRFEFGFVRQHGVKVVCIFTGNDIRSHHKGLELAERTGRPNLSAVTEQVNPWLASPEYEAQKLRIAQVADEFAQAVYNFDADQASYLTKPSRAFFYAYPDERLNYLPEKFDNNSPFVVVHAPSNPVIKGTSFVRDAVERLKSEGHEFEYVELMNVSNDEVLATLKRAHIVLNQFWALVPGVFGLEAMANTCAMLCSADGDIETGLAAGANQAWLQTSTTEVYKNLKRLLDDRALTKAQAIRGFEWVKTTAVASLNSAAFVRDLDSL